MDPIVSLHYYAPVCAVINAFILPFTEGLEPFYALHRVGLLVLFTNAGMAFALNVRQLAKAQNLEWHELIHRSPLYS
jgi:hypothetical protein